MRCLAEWPGDGVDLEHLHPFEGLVDIDLYSDQPQSAWNRVERTWPEIARSGLLRFTLFETFTHAARTELLDVAASRSKAKYATGLGFAIDAGTQPAGRSRQDAGDASARNENSRPTIRFPGCPRCGSRSPLCWMPDIRGWHRRESRRPNSSPAVSTALTGAGSIQASGPWRARSRSEAPLPRGERGRPRDR